jgi:deazaflavin-dependent oxidoreductase (nitroreductase family)
MTKPRPEGLDKPWVPGVMRRMSKAHVWVYRKTNGVLGGKWRVGAAFPSGVDVCLLTTKGRKSGETRTAPLLYLPDGERVVVVASQGGMPKHPLWYLNLQATPDVEVQVRGHRRRMRARTATSAERTAYWPRLVAMYSDYDDYQSWTTREIPVVILEPRD